MGGVATRAGPRSCVVTCVHHRAHHTLGDSSIRATLATVDRPPRRSAAAFARGNNEVRNPIRSSNRRNVHAAELEVRPPDAPTTGDAVALRPHESWARNHRDLADGGTAA